MTPQIPHCKEIGAMMAKMHLAAKDFPMQQANLRSFSWWKKTAPIVLPFLSENNAQLLREEMVFQETFFTSALYQDLPRGPIHADLFRNNAMFQGTQLSGIFDFYFAGYDTWLFDVAVTVNDWCIDHISGELDPLLTQSLLDAYQSVRPFTHSEQNAWQASLRGAALRFWLSRLYDYHLPRPAQMLTPHDPSHFERILRLRTSQLPHTISI
jgi:homoserine kinase type II